MKHLMYLFLFMVVFLIDAVPVNANEELYVQYKFNYDNSAAPNETLPVFVDITNKGSDFKGDFVFDNVDIYNGGSGIVLPFEVESGETAHLKFYINGISDNFIDSAMLKNRTFIYENSYVDGEKATVHFPKIQMPQNLGYEAQRILLISDDVDLASHIKNYTGAYGSQIKIAQASNADITRLAANRKDYDMYKIIVIDESGAKLLNEEHEQAIEEWVRQNGTLLLTGDVQLSKIEPLLSLSNGEVTTINSSKPPVIVQKDMQIAQLDYSNGQIIHASHSLSDKRFLEAPQIKKLLADVMQKSNYDLQKHEQYVALNWSHDNTYFDTFSINSTLIIILLLLYIIVIGPLLYIFLKKKDQREKMWLYIPVIAVVTSGVIFIFGAADRITKPLTQTMELVQLSGTGDATVHSSYMFVSNKRGDYTITAPLNSKLTAYRDSLQTPTQSIHDYAVLEEADEKQQLTLRKVPFWNVQGAVAEQFQTDIGQLNNTLKIENGELTGTIQNELPTDVADLMFISGRNIVHLGSIAAGATLEVQEKIDFATLAKPYDQLQLVDEATLATFSNEEKMVAQKMQSMMNTFNYQSAHKGPILVGLASTRFSAIELQGEEKADVLSLIVQQPNVELALTDSFTIHSEEFTASLTASSANAYAEIYMEDAKVFGTIYEGENIVTYSLAEGLIPSNTKWSELEVQFDRSVLDVSIYNIKTKQYEKLSKSPWMNNSKIMHYISEDLRVKFKVSTAPEQYGVMLEMPTFMLRGEAKDD